MSLDAQATQARPLPMAQAQEIRPNALEVARFLHGADHGMDSTVLLTESLPGGGPPAHRHPTEEIHVLSAGRCDYDVDGQAPFTVDGPAVVHLPGGQFHSFRNSGTDLLTMTVFFPVARVETEWRDGPPGKH